MVRILEEFQTTMFSRRGQGVASRSGAKSFLGSHMMQSCSTRSLANKSKTSRPKRPIETLVHPHQLQNEPLCDKEQKSTQTEWLRRSKGKRRKRALETTLLVHNRARVRWEEYPRASLDCRTNHHVTSGRGSFY